MAVAMLAAALPVAAQPAGDTPLDPYGAPKPQDRSPRPAQPEDPYATDDAPPPGKPGDDIDDQVGAALLERGMVLYRRGDIADARTLFIESLERSPRGPSSTEARRMLREANRSLGQSDLDAGIPGQGGPVDPYAQSDPRPADPFGQANTVSAADIGKGISEPASDVGRYSVIGFSSAVGALLGSALGGPTDDDGNLTEGATLGGLIGGGVGAGLSWWLTRHRPITAGQAVAINSGATWGAYTIGLLGDAVTGTESDGDHVYAFVAAGGAAGLGGGLYYAARHRPSQGDMSLINSLGIYGTTTGLMLGVAMDPPESEAYSINALVGALGGLAVGGVLARKVEYSRQRMLWIDLGAASGLAAGWALLYPLLETDQSNNDVQTVAFLSTLTMGGGALLAWYFTGDIDDGGEEQVADPGAPAALLTRSAQGRWAAGVPGFRPLVTGQGRIGAGVELLSGRF